VNVDSILDFIYGLNPFVIYGFAVFLTLLVILRRTRPLALPRPLALISWYTVLALAVSWLVFHIAYFLNHDPRDVGLAVIGRILGFTPVYVCALIVLFMYPRKTPRT
jgi:small neutral amino acid transporter SnatA (MarC family)